MSLEQIKGWCKNNFTIFWQDGKVIFAHFKAAPAPAVSIWLFLSPPQRLPAKASCGPAETFGNSCRGTAAGLYFPAASGTLHGRHTKRLGRTLFWDSLISYSFLFLFFFTAGIFTAAVVPIVLAAAIILVFLLLFFSLILIFILVFLLLRLLLLLLQLLLLLL